LIKIVTDANTNLPREIVDEYGITMVPAYVIFGQEALREYFELDSAGFFARLSENHALPTTSQPSIGDFQIVYRRILEEFPGATILSIHITSLGSGTFSSAQQAAKLLTEADIRLFDTRSFSLSQGLMVYEAARMARQGASPDDILARLADMRDRMQTYFVLDTLEYVYKGGRVGVATHMLGTLLDIKPVLTIRDGAIVPHSRHRTRTRAFAALRDMALEGGRGKRALRVSVMYALHDQYARELAEELKAALDIETLIVGDVGPALSVYTGPGALGVAWYAPPE